MTCVEIINEGDFSYRWTRLSTGTIKGDAAAGPGPHTVPESLKFHLRDSNGPMGVLGDVGVGGGTRRAALGASAMGGCIALQIKSGC